MDEVVSFTGILTAVGSVYSYIPLPDETLLRLLLQICFFIDIYGIIFHTILFLVSTILTSGVVSKVPPILIPFMGWSPFVITGILVQMVLVNIQSPELALPIASFCLMISLFVVYGTLLVAALYREMMESIVYPRFINLDTGQLVPRPIQLHPMPPMPQMPPPCKIFIPVREPNIPPFQSSPSETKSSSAEGRDELDDEPKIRRSVSEDFKRYMDSDDGKVEKPNVPEDLGRLIASDDEKKRRQSVPEDFKRVVDSDDDNIERRSNVPEDLRRLVDSDDEKIERQPNVPKDFRRLVESNDEKIERLPNIAEDARRLLDSNDEKIERRPNIPEDFVRVVDSHIEKIERRPNIPEDFVRVVDSHIEKIERRPNIPEDFGRLVDSNDEKIERLPNIPEDTRRLLDSNDEEIERRPNIPEVFRRLVESNDSPEEVDETAKQPGT